MTLFSELGLSFDKGDQNLSALLAGSEYESRSATADVYASHRKTEKNKPVQKYRMLGKKGEGSFAEVMACQSLMDGQLYACKRLKRHFISVEQALCLTEVRALRRLTPHINVVQLIDIIFDKKSGRLALVFELMDLNLYELLKARRKPLPEFRVRNYMYQLLKSLEHIHRHGIFHRDVKPENLLIRDNLLKLADFGSCRGMNTKKPYTEYISTRWYRPPECLLTSGYYTFKMDMWAAGCVFFEALTNLPLFPGSTEIDQLMKIHNVLGTPRQALLNRLRRHKRPGKFDFDFEPRPGIGLEMLSPLASENAHSLLSILVTYDEDDRVVAKEALRHKYFKDMRVAERYHVSGRQMTLATAMGKRCSSSGSNEHQTSSHSSSKSDVPERGEESPISEAPPESRKKYRHEQSFLLPVLEVNGSSLRRDLGLCSQSTDAGSLKCNTNRSINFPPIEKKIARRKVRRKLARGGHVARLPPIQQPWRP